MDQRIPKTMAAVLLLGHGGFDKLQFSKEVLTPTPGPGEVLIKVRGTSVNNTDINTRTAWYSKGVRTGTNEGATGDASPGTGDDASWLGQQLKFPLIQGADCYGTIVAAGAGSSDRIGEPVFVRNLLRAPVNFRPFESWTFGSEVNGGFAEYTVVHSGDAFRIESDLSDVELGAIPCAYSTAEGMLLRADVTAHDRVLVTGASGGVGLAAVQLAKLRGAHVTAVVSPSKSEALRRSGADAVVHRNDRLLDKLDRGAVTVVVDLVAGEQWTDLLPLLSRGGRYATAGAIGGPIVEMDVRTLYLNDLSLFGCTFQDDTVFKNIIKYLQANRLKPVIAKTFELSNIVEAQKYFMAKDFVGKVALTLPGS